MYIDESLAKGLKERLWNEIYDLNANGRHLVSQYVKTHKRVKSGSRTAWVKLNQIVQIGFEHNILAVVKAGTRNAPVLLYAILGNNPLEEMNEWKEKAFCIFSSSIDTYGNDVTNPVTVRIGEHAISRAFQRHTEIYDAKSKEFDVFKIITELKPIAFFAQAMLMLFMVLTEDYEHPIDNISIPFVSAHGMFLGSYNKQLHKCDVRTFVGEHQLSPHQLAYASQIRLLFEDYVFAGLPFVAREIKLQYLFLSQLNTIATQFAEVVTWNENNPLFRREFQKRLIDHLAEFEPYAHVVHLLRSSPQIKKGSNNYCGPFS